MPDSINTKRGFSRREEELLDLLIANKNRVLNRITILEHFWDMAGGSSDGSLEAHMNRLRSKMKKQGMRSMIKTFHGFGYMLSDTSD